MKRANDYWSKILSQNVKKVDFEKESQLEGTYKKTFTISNNSFLLFNKITKGSKEMGLVLLQAALKVFAYKMYQSEFFIGMPQCTMDLKKNRQLLISYSNNLNETWSIKELLQLEKGAFNELLLHQFYPTLELMEQNNCKEKVNLYIGMIDVHALESIMEIVNQMGMDITFLFDMKADSLILDLYASNGINSQYLDIIYRAFSNVLANMLEDASILVRDVEVINVKEKELLLNTFAGASKSLPKELVLKQIEKTAAIHGSKLALFSDSWSLTYGELNERANRLAHRLVEYGVEKNSIISILLHDSPEMYVGILAVMKSGACYLPIDPSYPEQRVNYIIEDSKSSFVLLHEATKGMVSSSSIRKVYLDDESSYSKDTDNPNIYIDKKDPAYIIYTSGTTGKPKGVCVGQESLLNLVNWHNDYYQVNESDIAGKYAGLGFDASVWELFPYITIGATIYAIPERIRLDVDKINLRFEENNVSIAFLPTAVFEQFIQLENKSLRCLLTGAEKLKLYKDKSYKIYNNYGPTEYTVVTTSTEVTREWDNIPIGKPIDNTKVLILSKTGTLLPMGVAGELCIAGKGIAHGYLANDQLTQEKFLTSSYVDNKKIYHTGDLAKWLPDGNLVYLGRIDSQIKLRGFRIELEEIEKNFLEIPGVKDVAVIVKKRDGEIYLCGFYTAKAELVADKIKDILSVKLPDYMIPTQIIKLPSIPLTANGKIDRVALEKIEIPESPNTGQDNAVTKTEKRMSLLFKQVLNISSVNVNASFFELGGHSLKATLLCGMISEEFGVEISFQDIFSLKSVRKLCKFIETCEAKEHTKILPAKEAPYYMLSSAQKRMYLIQEINPLSTAYNISGAIEIKGDLNIELVEKCFKRLIERHEILRTIYCPMDEDIVQIINPAEEIDYRLTVCDIGSQVNLKDLLSSFIRPFDLQRDIMLRTELKKRDDKDYVLLFETHHIAMDGFSAELMIQEFNKLYAGEVLEDPKIQYKDYTYWLHDQKMKKEYMDKEAYWLNEFNDDIPLLNMPMDYSRPREKQYDGDKVYFSIGKETLEKLYNISNHTGTTLFMSLLSAINILLYRYTNQSDLVVGTPISGRTHHDLERVFGMFVNTLPIRTQLTKGMSFEDLLLLTREKCLGAYSNQEYQFEDLVEKLNLERDISRNPIFDTMFTLQSINNNHFSADGLSFSIYERKQAEEKFDLTFEAREKSDGIDFSISYARSLYKEATIIRMAQHLSNIIKSIVNDISVSIDDIDIMSDSEKEILKEFNNTKAPYPDHLLLHEMMEVSAEKYAMKTAIACGDLSMTYKELNIKSNQLAWKLRKNGIKPNHIVGIMLERSLEMMVGILGILKAGAAYLPIDPNYPEDRVNYMLENAKVTILLTKTNLLNQITFEGMILDLNMEDSYDENKENLPKVNKPSDLAYILFTSGSTGKPKGVMVRQTAVINRLYWMQGIHPLKEEDNILQKTPYTFDVSVWELFWWYFEGAKLCFLNQGDEKSPEAILEAIKKFEITKIHFVPSMLNMFLEYISLNNLQDELKGIEYVFSSGEALTKDHVNKFNQVFKNINCQLLNLYGPTEATVEVSYFNCSNMKDYQSVPIGIPINNVEFYVVNNNHLQPIGVPGELYIGGLQLAKGYLANEELTKEKFIDNPFEEGTKLYKTGDLVRWLADGNIEYLGRLDHQVKIRGFRIELGEIESALLTYEGVKAAVVIDKTDKLGNKYLCAYLETDIEPAVDNVRSHLSKILPEYMIPSYFINMKQIPSNNNGKIDRSKLPEPDHAIYTGVKYEAPRNDVEIVLAEAWQKVLDIEKVGIRDNFFSLGGDSIKGIQLISQVKKSGYLIKMKQLFDYPTIAQISEYVEEDNLDIGQGIYQGEVELSPIQKWFFEQGFLNKEHWNQSLLLYKQDGMKKNIVAQAFEKVASHHDALRIILRDGSLYNRGIEEKLFLLDYFEIKAETSKDIEQYVQEFCDLIQSKIDLEKGPLVRLVLVHTNFGDYLAFIIHHLVIDGVSWRIILEDFTTAYHSIDKGEVIHLPKKTTAFGDWTMKLRDYAQLPHVKAEANYWLNMQNKISIEAEDHSDSMTLRSNIKTIETILTREETLYLIKGANNAYRTDVEELMLSALVKTLTVFFHNEQLLIALESHGREEVLKGVDISRTVGWFTALYPVLFDTGEVKDLSEIIRIVKDTLRSIPQNGIGYGILRYLTENSPLNKNIDPDICFNYLGQAKVADDNGLFELSGLSTGTMIGKENQINYSLDFSVIIQNDQLTIKLYYNSQKYDENTAENILKAYLNNLIAILRHCQTVTTPVYSVTDFSKENITIKELDTYKKEWPNIQEIRKVFPMQRGILYLSMNGESSTAYHETMVLDLNGDFCVETMQKAFEALVDRYDILRSNFDVDSFQDMMQIVYRKKEVNVEYLDFRIYGDCLTEMVNEEIKKEREIPYDFRKGMLIRLKLLQIADDRYKFILSNHHILMDGWSTGLILLDLFKLYNLILRQESNTLQPVASCESYYKWLESKNDMETKEYWKQYLQGLSNNVTLPYDVRKDGFSNASLIVTIDNSLKDKAIALAKEKQVTMNTLLQSVWVVILQKYCQLDDIVFGYTVSGRVAEVDDMDRMTGLFINTIPMRIKSNDKLGFDKLLKEVNHTLLYNQPYDYYPLADIQAQSELRNNLIQTLMVFENYPLDLEQLHKEFDDAGFQISHYDFMEETNFDLTLIISVQKEMTIKFLYNQNKYSESYIENIGRHFEAVMKEVIENCKTSIGDINLLEDDIRLKALQDELVSEQLNSQHTIEFIF